MKYSRIGIFWLVCLPVLTSGFPKGNFERNSFNHVESDEKSKLQNLRCEHYDVKCVEEENKNGTDASNCTGIQQCPKPNQHCYVVWEKETEQNQTSRPNFSHKSGKHVKKMGCIPSASADTCSAANTCLDTNSPDPDHGHFFCCCKSDLCNANFKAVEPIPEPLKPSKSMEPRDKNDFTPVVIVCIVVAAFVVITGIIFFFAFKLRKKSDNLGPIDQTQPLMGNPSMPQSLSGISQEQQNDVFGTQFVTEIGKGKYGSVWSAKNNTEEFAIKTFNLAHKKSWEDEINIYKLPLMDTHPNILKYLWDTQRPDNINTEFWLATELQKECLHTYLKTNTVSWEKMCKIALSMMEGLTFLHEECHPRGNGLKKPAIAHRDFKSKNVLIKKDLTTACIADFGLAMPLDNIGDTHGQVGTIRYMAPEVLEGAINFSRDAFLRIDMYACALVLWELASRCKMNSEDFQVFEYKLPFEAEEDEQNKMKNVLPTMQDLVVTQKLKPKIHDSWRSQPQTKILCDTIEECWDQDAEARLSASCVVERVKQLISISRNQLPRETERNTVDSGVEVSGGSDNSTDENINSSDEIPMSELSSTHPFGQT